VGSEVSLAMGKSRSVGAGLDLQEPDEVYVTLETSWFRVIGFVLDNKA
jgi:hypothetical protein